MAAIAAEQFELHPHTTSTRLQWQDRAVAEYMKDVHKLKEGLFVLAYLSGGIPARGYEITSIPCENGEEGIGYHGIFVEGATSAASAQTSTSRTTQSCAIDPIERICCSSGTMPNVGWWNGVS